MARAKKKRAASAAKPMARKRAAARVTAVRASTMAARSAPEESHGFFWLIVAIIVLGLLYALFRYYTL